MGEPEVGLRERKKQQTRRTLVDHGMRLFQERGFDATTIEEIAAAANVAPRTFFRYFKTKEELFGADQAQEDQLLRDVLASRKPGEDDVALLGRAMLALLNFNSLERTVAMSRVVLSTPSLRAHVLEEMLRTERILSEGLVGKKASKAELFRARMLASASINMFFSVLMSWAEGGHKGNVVESMRPCLEWLRSGFVPRR